MNETPVVYHRRRSLVFPLLLIALGVVFLLNNVGMLPGSFWEAAARFWPVLLIIFSLDEIYRGGGLVGAAFWMGLGVIFLLINLNVLPWNIWDILFRFWPVIIILAGIDIILGRQMRSGWRALVGLVIVLAVLAGILVYANSKTTTGQLLTGQSVEMPLQGVSSAMITLSPAVANAYIQDFRSDQLLVSGKIQTGNQENVRQDKTSTSGSASYSLQSQGLTISTPFSNINAPSWDIKLNQQVPIEITFKLGVGEATLDLSQLKVTGLSVDSAIGKTTVIMPESGSFNAKLNGAIGETIIILLPGSNARVNVTSGIASLNVKGNLVKNGNSITTPNFDPNQPHLEIQAGEAIGDVTIQTQLPVP